MKPKVKVKSNRSTRHFRIRKAVSGTTERPRLSVRPSLNHFTAQIINDVEGKTIFGMTTGDKNFKKAAQIKSFGNVKAAVEFGKYFASKAKEKGLSKVVFDRGGYLYHGRIKAFADAARDGGLSF